MNYIVHDKAGKILRAINCSPALSKIQAKKGEFILEGWADDNKQKVIGTGKARLIVDKTPEEIEADNPPPLEISPEKKPAVITNEQWQDVLTRLDKFEAEA